jgi:cytochrome P450
MLELFDPHSNEWLLNKFEIYKDLRSRNTAYYSEKYKMHIFTRHSDVKAILSNPEVFSSARGNLVNEHEFRFGRTLGASDDPDHNIFKNIVKNAYSKENISRIAEVFERNAKILLVKKSLNISEVIEELSAWATAELLNLPYEKEKIKNLVLDIQRRSPLAVANSTNTASDDEFIKIVQWAIKSKIEPAGPGIYKEFIEKHPADLRPLISLFQGPTISGASSLTGALQFLTLDLYRHGVIEKLLKDNQLIPQAIEESLRLHASTGRFSRTVTKDITLHGIDLVPGNRVVACLDAANRDPLQYDNPDRFDLNRNTTGNMAFGYGMHACIALAISKSLMHKYLEVLLDQIGNYKVTTEDSNLSYVMTSSGNNDMISNLVIDPV